MNNGTSAGAGGTGADETVVLDCGKISTTEVIASKAARSCARELSWAGTGVMGAGAVSATFMQQEEPHPQGILPLQPSRTGDAKAGRCESTSARLKRMVTMAFTCCNSNDFDPRVKGLFKTWQGKVCS